MPGSPAQSEQVVKAVKLDVKALDRHAERFLNVLVRGPRFKGYAFSNKPDFKEAATFRP
jgi:beta-glucosidase